MAYVKITWNNGRPPAISATNLNHIEQGIEDAHNMVDALSVRYGTPLTASLVSEMTDTTKIYVYTGSETGMTSGNWYYYDTLAATPSWVSGGVYNAVAVQTDTTLTQSGIAADAKKTGDEISDLKSQLTNGVPYEIKQALDNILQNVAFKNDNGYSSDLTAIHAWATSLSVTSISAVYTQSGTVYDTDSLDDLKADLVVTAHYSDNSTGVVTNYTLTGTLTVGTSTITVSYEGKTTTFTVTVTEYIAPFATYSGNVALSKWNTTGQYPNAIIRSNASPTARACMDTPVYNNNYVFASADTTKYQIAVYDVTDMNKITIPSSYAPQAIDGFGYQGGTKTVAWANEDSVTTPYVWVSFKKLDGTDFTSAELANMEGTVFTYREYQPATNLFDSETAPTVNMYVNTGQSRFQENSSYTSTYIPIDGGKTYRITKTATNQFRIATSASEPVNYGAYLQTEANHTGTTITITADSSANYLFITYWYNQGDYDASTIRNSIVVEEVTV